MIIKCCLLISLTLLLSSCSTQKDEKNINTGFREDDVAIVEEQAASPAVDARQPIYIYNQQKQNEEQETTLRLNGDPLLLRNNYVRLVGVVSGGRPMALVEVGGRGCVLGAGEMVSGCRVVSIMENCIILSNAGGSKL